MEFVSLGIDADQLMVAPYLGFPDKFIQKLHEAARSRITKIRDVVYVCCKRRKRAAQHLFDRGFVHARPDPVGGHLLRCGRMVLERVIHGERAGESFAIGRYKPIGIISDLAQRPAVRGHESLMMEVISSTGRPYRLVWAGCLIQCPRQ